MSDNKAFKQLELGIARIPEQDRNFHLGGRSFYFFDFDDNIAFLATPMFLKHKFSGAEIAITSSDFAKYHHDIGKNGPYREYEIDWNDETGSFRNFRDKHIDALEALNGKTQVFIQDVIAALGGSEFEWKGPSWDCFYHATFNQRPISLITARGHNPETFKQGIQIFVEKKILPIPPNYLSIFPVNHLQTRQHLGDIDFKMPTAELKRRAIRLSFQKALQDYGLSSYHRFGMSDDDPKNLQMIYEEMKALKTEYPDMSFFIIDTGHGQFKKYEVDVSGSTHLYFLGSELESFKDQLNLFNV